MPRGEVRQMKVLARTFELGGPPLKATEDAPAAIRGTVREFARAWYWGEPEAMLRCLHPDYTNRLIALGSEARPVGVQGTLGVFAPADRRTVEVRILEVRAWSASAVAELNGWVLHLHLARAEGQWKIVNAMWESGKAS